jgi:8-oxo-dGTP diphosphatase
MNQQVSVAAVMTHAGRILAVRRSQKEAFLPGVFELPGGKVEFGEQPDVAIEREVLEETGVRASIRRILTARSYLSKSGTQHNIEIIYIVTPLVDEPTIRLSDAHDEYLWIGPPEVKSLGLPNDDPIRLTIQAFFDSEYGDTATHQVR